jgi:hypothetical protein
MYLTLVLLSFPTRKPLSWFVFGESEVRFLVRTSAMLTFAQFSYASRSKCQEIALNWTTATFSTCLPVTQSWHPPSRQFTSKAIESASMTNHCITQCNRALFEKLTVSQLVQPFPNPKVQYVLHKSPPLASILSQMSSIRIFTPVLTPPFDLRLGVPSCLYTTQWSSVQISSKLYYVWYMPRLPK